MSKQSDLVNIAQGDTITVDHANGKVGIGTSSPSRLLDVNGIAKASVFDAGGEGFIRGDAAGELRIQSGTTATTFRNNANNTEFMRIDSNGNVGIGSNVTNRLALTYDQTSGLATVGPNSTDGSTALSFGTSLSGSYAERMRIDSAGNVTKPYQPMFLGYPTNDYSGGGMPIGVMSVTAVHNNGGHFNASNSRFTAPVAGWYLTTWGGLQLNNTVTSLMINGTRTHSGNHGVYTGSYITMTQTAIVSLNAGDYLNIEQWNGGGYFSGWYLWSVTLLG